MLAQLHAMFDPSDALSCAMDRLEVAGPVQRRRETWRGRDRGGNEWELAVETILVLDDAGRSSRLETFLAGDPRIEEAVARLAEPPAAEDPVSLAPVVDPGHPAVEATRAQCLAFNRRDWAAVRALFAPGYEAFDRRAVGWERLDLDLLLETGRTAVVAAPDMTTTAELLACDHAITARIQHYRGHARDGGGLLDVSQGEIAIYDDEGRVACEEFFDADDRESLMARYEELLAERENLAVRARKHVTAAIAARDDEALRGLYAADAVTVDHRPPGAADVGTERRESRPGATRGRRLALFVEGEQRVLVQADHDGRIWRTDVYAAQDEAAALERLDALAAADAVCAETLAAYLGSDWDRLAQQVAPGFVLAYHPTGDRFSGVEAALEHWRSVRAPTSGFSGSLDRVDVHPGGVFTRRETWAGREPQTGVTWESALEAVIVLAPDGRMVRAELFLPGDPRRNEVLARLVADATSPA
jgi:hypothetical protein